MDDYVHLHMSVTSDPRAIEYATPELIDDEILEFVIRAGEEYLGYIPASCISPYAEELIHCLYPYQALFQKEVQLNELQTFELQLFYKRIGL